VTFSVGQATLLPRAPLEVRVVSDSKVPLDRSQEGPYSWSMIFVAGIEKEGYEFLSKGEKRASIIAK